jgi:hypothetical protein
MFGVRPPILYFLVGIGLGDSPFSLYFTSYGLFSGAPHGQLVRAQTALPLLSIQ